jgi:hypothetical protein
MVDLRLALRPRSGRRVDRISFGGICESASSGYRLNPSQPPLAVAQGKGE